MTATKLIAAGAALIAGIAFTGTSAQANEDGGKVFRTKCGTCHTVEKGKHKVGPSLIGIVDRQAGTSEGFTRYVGLKGASFKWTEEDLDKYLTDPDAFVKAKGAARSGMAFKLPNAKERKDVIEYLEKAK